MTIYITNLTQTSKNKQLANDTYIIIYEIRRLSTDKYLTVDCAKHDFSI